MLTPPFLDMDLGYCWGELKKPNVEISYFSVEQSISILQYVAYMAIPAIQITSHEIATRCVSALLSKSAGQIYQLPDLMGISHDI